MLENQSATAMQSSEPKEIENIHNNLANAVDLLGVKTTEIEEFLMRMTGNGSTP